MKTNSGIEITNENNFCRVFELPKKYPNEYCFNGGHPISFKMVDWFNPVPSETMRRMMESPPATWDEVKTGILIFLKSKSYVIKGKTYLVITDFDESFIFTKEAK